MKRIPRSFGGNPEQTVADIGRLLTGLSLVLRNAARLHYEETTKVASNFIYNNRSGGLSGGSFSSPDPAVSGQHSQDSSSATVAPPVSTTTSVQDAVKPPPVIATPPPKPAASPPVPMASTAPTAAASSRATTSSAAAVGSTKPASNPLAPPPPTGRNLPESVTDRLRYDSAYPAFTKADAKSTTAVPTKTFEPSERAVPSTPLGRALGFANLGVSLALGTIKDFASGATRSTPAASAATTGTNGRTEPPAFTNFISETNAERLAAGLCRMRGAALKIGQMLSIQDESMVPPQLQAILQRVRDSADVMPQRQLEKVMKDEFGENWRSKLKDFQDKPIAAASIGQVHRATLLDGRNVVMKIQYPGVARSIRSDISNLKRLLLLWDMFPKGLYIDEAMKVAEEELTAECDYEMEAKAQERFRKLLADEPGVNVPAVIPELSTKRVLTTMQVEGIPVDKLSDYHGMPGFDEAARNSVAYRLLRVCLRELFEFRFMQTDPNWSNFLYDPKTGMLHLIDFGAAREFSQEFTGNYLRMVAACARRDRQAVLDYSRKLGFLTGDESRTMHDAHVEAAFIVGEPFGTVGCYDFVKGNIPDRVSRLAGVMVRTRLTAPPREAYSLHRKLSGAILTCKKLNAVIPCKETFDEFYSKFQFQD